MGGVLASARTTGGLDIDPAHAATTVAAAVTAGTTIAIAAALAAARGARLLRVHDVAATRDALAVMQQLHA